MKQVNTFKELEDKCEELGRIKVIRKVQDFILALPMELQSDELFALYNKLNQEEKIS